MGKHWIISVVGWAVAVVVWSAAVPSARSQALHYSGSVQYATGSYIFAERTHSVYVSNGFDWSHDRFQGAASLPIIYQTSPWISYSVIGGVPSGGPQQGAVGGSGNGPGGGGQGSGRRRGGEPIVLPDTATYADVGVGDPSLRTDYTLLRGSPGPSIRVAGSVKAPLADVDRGFGTGAWDAGLGVSVSQRLGSWFLFGEAMHWWLGDMDDVSLNNSVAYSASLGRSFQNGTLGLLATVSGYTAALVDDAEPPLQSAVGLSHLFGDGGRYGINASASFGLTESSPDATLALGWRIAL